MEVGLGGGSCGVYNGRIIVGRNLGYHVYLKVVVEG